jgi:hypothetical protein
VHSRVLELDFEYVVCDGPLLPYKLIQTMVRHDTVPLRPSIYTDDSLRGLGRQGSRESGRASRSLSPLIRGRMHRR